MDGGAPPMYVDLTMYEDPVHRPGAAHEPAVRQLLSEARVLGALVEMVE
jgi:hypothetical protein